MLSKKIASIDAKLDILLSGYHKEKIMKLLLIQNNITNQSALDNGVVLAKK